MLLKLLSFFALTMALVLGLFHSVTVTVAWWNGDLAAGPWDWLWIGLLPVWLFVFFRYYSVFRPGCRASMPPEESYRQHRDS